MTDAAKRLPAAPGHTRSMPVTIYTPESKIRKPFLLLKEMFRDLTHCRELAWRLMIRDISALYRQTALGYFWAVFPPLVSAAVFLLLKSSDVMKSEEMGVPYPVYVLMGVFFFQLFVDALNAPLKIVTEAKAILGKINMPREALILSGMGQVLFSFVIKMVMLIGVLVIFHVKVAWTAVLVPIPLIGLLLFGTMIGVLLIPVGLLYKDIQSSLLIVTQGLVFLTPVGFSPKTGGLLEIIMKWNPVTPLLMNARELVLTGIPANLTPSLIVLGVTLIMLFVGWVIYRLALPIIIERIGA